MNKRRFLTAEWRYLAMLNYLIDPAALLPRVPAGTELDSWNGRTFVSVVGFLFLRTRVLGCPVPFHQNFEEVNLRFYVRRKSADGWRRGVVFMKEIVPRYAIAWVARALYNENYVAMPMRHRIELEAGRLKPDAEVEYGWRYHGLWNHLRVKTRGEAQAIADGSEEEFITEHYWGYAAQKGGGSVEYQVEHPRWRVWQVSEATLDCQVADLYGPQFKDALNAAPSSAFVAEGSPITVYRGSRIR
ncbi:MAG TPA: DUF2071 domain-containing protein [Blastocatellia bacterium]|nr:DUF2071 domain-containing protein [Blastocatellia bacterium]